MTIAEFLKFKEIHPKELEEHFEKVKTVNIDIFNHKGCYNCGDKINQQSLPTLSWCHVQYCWVCNSINMVFEQDRMGGAFTDHIEIYQEKK